MAHTEAVRVAVYGGGELGTAVAHRLTRAGFAAFVVEVARPTSVCRAVAAAHAVYQGSVLIDGLVAELAAGAIFAEGMLSRRVLPVLAEPTTAMMERLAPRVYVDATAPRLSELPFALPQRAVAVAVGGRRTAGREVAAVVDTRPLPSLGAVLSSGATEEWPDDASPYLPVRSAYAGNSGVFVAHAQIGDHVLAGDELGVVNGHPVMAPVEGHVRGLLADGLATRAGQLVAEIDLSGDAANCFTISAWARAVAGGVLEAVVALTR